MAEIILTGVSSHPSIDAVLIMYFDVTMDTAEKYKWADAARLESENPRTFITNKLATYVADIQARIDVWVAASGMFPSTDPEGNPIQIYISKEAYVQPTISITDVDMRRIKDGYVQALADLATIQAYVSPTNAQVVAAVKKVAQIEEYLLKFLKRLFYE